MAAQDLYLKLDSSTWNEFDFDDTNGITGTIYTDRAFSSAKDLTGYTIYIRLFRRWRNHTHLNKEATIVTAASGTWKYLPLVSAMPRSGVYMIEIQLEKSGSRKSTRPIEFYIRRGVE